MDQKQALSGGYDRSAPTYDQTAGGIYLRTLWNLLPCVNLLEAARVLGPCRRLAGVDLSPGMLAVARHKAEVMDVAATFTVGDAEALDVEDGAFDLVICNSAYHWFPDRARAVKELGRALRPGGQLLLASLAQPGYEEWMRAVNGVWMRLFGRACPAFPEMPSAAEVQGHVRAAGLSIERSEEHTSELQSQSNL